MLNSERFCDQAPAQIWATLLDEGRYLASVSTMYRILRAQHQVRERRRQARHPAHVKPELVADGPNQVWSWDITKLAGPHKWNWFHLYVILDVYSRYAVGWLVAPRESDRLAHELIAVAHARTFTDDFFDHYNHHHRHSGIGYHTPASVHHGHHHAIRAHRQAVLDHAYTLEPQRFRRPPIAPQVPDITWINQPQPNLSHTP